MAQQYFATNWFASNWITDNWWSAAAGPPSFDFQIVAAQQDQYTGTSRWIQANWLVGNWVSQDWFSAPGWRLTMTGAPQQFTTTFDIPELDIVPQWVFRTGVGVTASIIPPTQANQTATIRIQYLPPGNDKIAQIVSQQADQTANIRMLYVPNPDTRDARLVVTQENQELTMRMTFVATGGTGDKRYGRKF